MEKYDTPNKKTSIAQHSIGKKYDSFEKFKISGSTGIYKVVTGKDAVLINNAEKDVKHNPDGEKQSELAQKDLRNELLKYQNKFNEFSLARDNEETQNDETPKIETQRTETQKTETQNAEAQNKEFKNDDNLVDIALRQNLERRIIESIADQIPTPTLPFEKTNI